MKNILIIVTLIAFLGCESRSKTEGHDHEESSSDDIVSLSKAQMEAIDLKLTHLEDKNMSSNINVNGSIELPPHHIADISPLMGGVIKNIFVIEGDKVKKGQTLATLEHPDFIDMQNNYINNLTKLEYVEKEYQRQEKLNSEKVVSDKSFQAITSEYKILKSTIQTQKIKLQMVGLSVNGIESGKIYSTVSITAPFNGYVSVIETNIGSFVAPQSKLFEIVNNDELHADFMVYEKDINKIEVGQTVFFTTSSFSQEFEAEIHNISPVFEENPKALHVHADIISSKDKLIPGMYINGRLLADNVITKAILSEAIINAKGKDYIFVKAKTKTKTDKFTFRKVEVIKGVESGNYTAITPLLKMNDSMQVVGKGAYFVFSELSKEENEHSH
jgi:cobalt-zinc-cadmium efflux system membrane fusion protein